MVNWRAAREGSPSLSIPHYPSCSERRAQLGTGYWLSIDRTPRKPKIAGYREAPQFTINPFRKNRKSWVLPPVGLWRARGPANPLHKTRRGSYQIEWIQMLYRIDSHK